MLHAFLADDPTTTNEDEDREPDFVFGFYPTYLPTWLVPWQAILESMFFEVIVMDLCFIHSVTGIATALLPIHLIKFFGNPFGVLAVSAPAAPIFRRARSRMLTIRNAAPAAAPDETGVDNNHIPDENYNNQLRLRAGGRHRRHEGYHHDHDDDMDQNLTEENSDTEDERDMDD